MKGENSCLKDPGRGLWFHIAPIPPSATAQLGRANLGSRSAKTRHALANHTVECPNRLQGFPRFCHERAAPGLITTAGTGRRPQASAECRAIVDRPVRQEMQPADGFCAGILRISGRRETRGLGDLEVGHKLRGGRREGGGLAKGKTRVPPSMHLSAGVFSPPCLPNCSTLEKSRQILART